MNKLFSLVLTFTISSTSLAQLELKGVMGINFLSTPSLNDYLDQSFSNSSGQSTSISSAVNFAVEAGYFFSPEFLLSLEGAYQIYSYNSTSDQGTFEFNWNSFMPSILAYYVLGGEGYNFKFGGGAGLRFSMVQQKIYGPKYDYSSTGVGFLLRAEGNTLLSGNLYANIGVDVNYDINGKPEKSNGSKIIYSKHEIVDLNSFSLGVRLGIAYYFGRND